MVASGGAPSDLTPGGAAAGRDVDVLVVGAGPVGMALALQAHQHGARVLLVERRTDLSRPSRAMLLWPRTLEALDRLGVADRLAEHPAARLCSQIHLGRHAVPVALADLAVPGASRSPLMVRQADVERALHDAVQRHGIPLRAGTGLSALQVDDEGATVVLTHPGGHEQVRRCRFVVGCDGAESAVRDLVGIPWRGRAYPQEAVLADAEVEDLADGLAHIGAGRAGVGFLFPAGEHGAGWRLVATRSARGTDVPPGRDGPRVGLPGIQGALRGANLPGRVAVAPWSTRVRLQRRLAGRFREGPVLLAGDAAHVMSPAGAQGLNTGLQDATNLGWKLAAVVAGSSHPEVLLDSYEAERRPVARQVGRLTGLLLHGEGDGRQPFRTVRTALLPAVAPLVPTLLRVRTLTGAGGWVLAQGWVAYSSSPLSRRGSRRPPRRLRVGRHAADLALRVGGRTVGLHALTAAPGVHVLHGTRADAASAARPGVHVHAVDSWPSDLVVALRPDGYVGFTGGQGDQAALAQWLEVVAPTRGA